MIRVEEGEEKGEEGRDVRLEESRERRGSWEEVRRRREMQLLR